MTPLSETTPCPPSCEASQEGGTVREAPAFTGKVQVHRCDDSGLGLIMACVVAAFLISFSPLVPAFFVLSRLADGGLQLFVGLVCVILLMLVLIAPFLKVLSGLLRMVERWHPARGFSDICQLEAGGDGLKIDGLGLVPWSHVSGMTPVPEEEHMIVVQTAHLGSLMLTLPDYRSIYDTLVSVIAHYVTEEKRRSPEEKERVHHALIFRRREFYGWIGLGYALAIGVPALVIASGEVSFDSLMKWLGIPLLSAASAYLPWTHALDLLSGFYPRRIKGLRLDGERLSSLDGAIDIDLRRAGAMRRHARGIGYDFFYLRVIPVSGREVCFVEPDDDRGWPTFRERIQRIASSAADGSTPD